LDRRELLIEKVTRLGEGVKEKLEIKSPQESFFSAV
jgi:hypothetical protein